MSPQYWLLLIVLVLAPYAVWRSVRAVRRGREQLGRVSNQATLYRTRVSVKYRTTDLLQIGVNNLGWRRRLGWSPITFVGTYGLTVRERSIQIASIRPGYITGLGVEFYLDPKTTRVRVVKFRQLFGRLSKPFVVFSQLGPDSKDIDLIAITRRDGLNEILDAISAIGPERIDSVPTIT